MLPACWKLQEMFVFVIQTIYSINSIVVCTVAFDIDNIHVEQLYLPLLFESEKNTSISIVPLKMKDLTIEEPFFSQHKKYEA